MLDLAAVAAAASLLYHIDKTFDPEEVLSPSDCALVAVAAFALGFAFKGVSSLFLTWLLTCCRQR